MWVRQCGNKNSILSLLVGREYIAELYLGYFNFDLFLLFTLWFRMLKIHSGFNFLLTDAMICMVVSMRSSLRISDSGNGITRARSNRTIRTRAPRGFRLYDTVFVLMEQNRSTRSGVPEVHI